MSTTLSQRPLGRTSGWETAQLVLNLLTVAAMAALMWVSLLYAKDAANLVGVEQTAQRIFYIHIGCNVGASLAFIISLVGSIAYLVTRHLDWDRVTQASIEVGTICAMGTTLSGSLWAKPAWNTYWTWDPRLTSITITLLIYIAYLLFRNGIDNRQTRARFGSIYALIAFLSVPFTYFSARWFRSIHPVIVNGANPDAQGGFGVGATMGHTLIVATVAFSLLFCALMFQRLRQLRLEDRIEEIREEIE